MSCAEPKEDGYYWYRDADGWFIGSFFGGFWSITGEEIEYPHEQMGIEEWHGPLDEPSPFTSGAFIVPATDAPVVGWVTMRADLAEVEIEKRVERAVVVSAADVRVLRDIREILEGQAAECETELDLLKRLIGR